MTTTQNHPLARNITRRGYGMDYGTKECEMCGHEFEAHSSRHIYCEACAAVRQANSMRTSPASCRGCGSKHYRRDGRDYYCPRCHLHGGGLRRYDPDTRRLLRRCRVCDQTDVASIHPDFPVCASCVAAYGAFGTPEGDRALQVTRELMDYVYRAEDRKTERARATGAVSPGKLQDATARVRELSEVDHPDTAVIVRQLRDDYTGSEPFDFYLDAQYTAATDEGGWLDYDWEHGSDGWVEFVQWSAAHSLASAALT